jgi:hypothetical protein
MCEYGRKSAGVKISGGPRLLYFQKDSLGSNVDIPPGSLFLFFSICVNHRLEDTFFCRDLLTIC